VNSAACGQSFEIDSNSPAAQSSRAVSLCDPRKFDTAGNLVMAGGQGGNEHAAMLPKINIGGIRDLVSSERHIRGLMCRQNWL
jgi:hypothetical protein